MTSFAVAIEPAAQPRLAAALVLLHAASAAAPWFAHCPVWLAAALGLLSLAGCGWSVARVPGAHGQLNAVAIDARGWRVRLAGEALWRPAVAGTGSRAYAECVLLDVKVNGRRVGWLLTRSALPPDAFRRLKARLRLTC